MTTELAPPFPSGALVQHMRESTQFQFHEVSGTRVHATMMLTEDHHQPFGIVHGGVYAFAVEGVASYGANVAIAERGMYAVGVNNSTDFLRPMVNGRVDVIAQPIFQGRSQQLWGVEITRESDGKLVARGQVRLYNRPRE
jgi:1,4-dihydroxy-2-naphthoyl-CoA hydrolase